MKRGTARELAGKNVGPDHCLRAGCTAPSPHTGFSDRCHAWRPLRGRCVGHPQGPISELPLVLSGPALFPTPFSSSVDRGRAPRVQAGHDDRPDCEVKDITNETSAVAPVASSPASMRGEHILRFFRDVEHVALTRALAGAEPLAPEAFVVNFSVGFRRSSFSGRFSSLARLLDWWAHSEGVRFEVSSGNVLEDLGIPGMTSVAFEEAT